MNELTYVFQETTVRIMMIESEPWFVGTDVATALGYSNPRDALARHVDEEDKNTVVIHDGTPGNPNVVIINELGVYSLTFSSQLESAKKFKHWVTYDVRPSIRKQGFYSMLTDDKLIEVLTERTKQILNIWIALIRPKSRKKLLKLSGMKNWKQPEKYGSNDLLIMKR